MSRVDEKKIRALFVQAKAGDASALESLCSHILSVLERYFASKIQDPAEAADLCQETAVRMVQHFDRVRQPEKLRAFAIKVAFHVLQDHLRRKYRRRVIAFEDLRHSVASEVDAPAASESQAEADSIVARVDLQAAIERLPSKSRQILLLRYRGFTFEEIAAVQEMSVSGVKMHVRRVFEKLKNFLQFVTFIVFQSTL